MSPSPHLPLGTAYYTLALSAAPAVCRLSFALCGWQGSVSTLLFNMMRQGEDPQNQMHMFWQQQPGDDDVDQTLVLLAVTDNQCAQELMNHSRNAVYNLMAKKTLVHHFIEWKRCLYCRLLTDCLVRNLPGSASGTYKRSLQIKRNGILLIVGQPRRLPKILQE